MADVLKKMLVLIIKYLYMCVYTLKIIRTLQILGEKREIIFIIHTFNKRFNKKKKKFLKMLIFNKRERRRE